MRNYRTTIALSAVILAAFLADSQGAQQSPFKLVKTMIVPGLKDGDWDHMCADLPGNRLFSAHETNQTVEVFDLKTQEHIGSVGKGILEQPHSLLYRNDLNRLYVVDGDHKLGAVRIFDGKDFKLIKSIDFPLRADWSGYDSATQILYVNNNGKNYNKPESFVEIFDTNAGEITGTIPVHDDVLTDFQMETENSNMYTGERTKKKVAVIDREKKAVVAEWPLTLGEGMGHMGIDRTHHRLFVNCRYGEMVYFDTQTGKEKGAFAINQYSDELIYDEARKRIYITASGAVGVGHGSVEAFKQIDPDHYESLGEAPTGKNSRNGMFIPSLSKIYVSVPKNGSEEARVLVFQVL